MSHRTRVRVVIVAATLLLWQGLLQSAPHHHADTAVSQERLTCLASHPSSHESHLHGSGPQLTPHRCLACLAASTAGVVCETGVVRGPCAERAAKQLSSLAVRQQPPVHARLFRGPPVNV